MTTNVTHQPIVPTEETLLNPGYLDKTIKETVKEQNIAAENAEVGKPPSDVNAEAIRIKEEGPVWYLDEGVQGVGERPDYLLEKFKTVTDQAKSFNELEQRFGSFKGAPDEYSLDMGTDPFTGKDYATGEELLPLNTDNPFLKEFLGFAKEGNASQEFVSKALNALSRYEQSKMINFDKEREQLGAEGPAMTKRVSEWLADRFDKDKMAWIGQQFRTSDHVRFLDHLISKIPQTAIPSSGMQPPKPAETYAQIRQEMVNNGVKYETDPVYRESIQDRLGALKEG